MEYVLRAGIQTRELLEIARHLENFDHGYGANLSDPKNFQTLSLLVMQKAVSSLVLKQNMSDGTSPVVATGITGYLDYSFAKQLLDHPPHGNLVEALYKIEQSGQKVFLRPKPLGQCNASDGVALVFLHFSAPSGDPTSSEVSRATSIMQSNIRLQHGGNHCRIILHPSPGPGTLGGNSLLSLGFSQVPGNPHLMSISLDEFRGAPFNPLVCLKRTALPQFGFSHAEQELLMLAIWGYGDDEIAESLHITKDTVKKRWRSIFEASMPLFKDEIISSNQKRGKEKRTRILQYLDTHLEELRPFAQR